MYVIMIIGDPMRKILTKCDKPLFIATIIYSILGLIMIFSASNVSTLLRYHVSTYHFFIRQAIFILFSLIVGFLFVLRIPIKRYRHFAIPIIATVIAALIGLFAYGKITNNAQSWYNFGPINIQPSEFAKSAIIIFMAVFYDLVSHKKNIPITFLFVPLAIVGIIAILVVMQPDLGSAIIILAIAFGIFISIPNIRKNLDKVFKYLFIGIILLICALLVGGKNILNSRQLRRFQYQNPCSRYREETGYQVCNGFIAIHNGGLLGKGLGNSTQKYLYLPESHTDFIFPIIVEELGLIISIIIILGYAFILFRILKICKKSNSMSGAIISYGAFLYILCHVLVNLLGILALIPLTGVPLPLLSYGGSFTINIILVIFMVERVAIEANDHEIKQTIAKITR